MPTRAGSETEIEMKTYYIAAAALLVGTSAMAWQPKDAWLDSKDGDKVATAAWDGAKMAKADGLTVAKTDFDTAKSGVMAATWDDLGRAQADPGLDRDLGRRSRQGRRLKTVETVAVDPTAGDPDLDLAEEPADDLTVASEPAMGGPLEDATTGDINMAAADLATRPAAQNYPPCRPGPGDDNCIQLYEPGVRTALASWNRPTGGLAGETQTAMGGPYEPVDEATAETAMNGDGDVDMAMGETEQSETLGV